MQEAAAHATKVCRCYGYPVRETLTPNPHRFHKPNQINPKGMLCTQAAAAPDGAKVEAGDKQKARKGCPRPSNAPRPVVRTYQKSTASFIISVHELLVVCGINDVVGKVDQELSKTALGSSIIPQNGGESSITKRLRQTLAERLTGASVIAQAVQN